MSPVKLLQLNRGFYQIKKNIVERGFNTVSDNEMLVKMIQSNFDNLRSDMNRRLDKIDNKFDKMEKQLNEVVTIDDCKKNRKMCLENISLKKSEIGIRRITAIGGVVTGTIAASSVIVVAILKLFFPI